MFKLLKSLLFRKKTSTPAKKKTAEAKLTRSLKANITLFKELLAKDDTVRFRELETAGPNVVECCAIFLDGMINSDILNSNIIRPLMESTNEDGYRGTTLLDFFQKKVIVSSSVKKTSNLAEIIPSILYGDTLLLVEGAAEALIIETKGWNMRGVESPISENSLRGSKEGFTESILVNISLIRRRILNPDLKFVLKELGSRTKTKICICYVESIVSEKILKEVEKRLEEIKIDGVLDSGYIEEMIKDSPLSPFKTIGTTERPDTVAGKLLEGRVVILCDGTPQALTIPFLFGEYFQTSEDYYINFISASFNRLFRPLGFFMATSIPAIYIALVTYHQEMMPTPLLLSISASREGVPFPSFIETLSLSIVFVILREASVRVPTSISQTISIVGALVLGEAAVMARIFSAPVVIVTALTGISTYLTPNLVTPSFLIRLIFLLLASILGLYGYIFGIIGLFLHLMSMRSFGVPYMLHTTALDEQAMKDTFIRAPWWYMELRPKFAEKNSVRKAKPKSGGRT